MAGILKLDQLEEITSDQGIKLSHNLKDPTGNNILTVGSSNASLGSGIDISTPLSTATFPAGHVIQSKTSTLTSGFNFTVGGANAGNNSGNNGTTDSDGTASSRADSTWGGIVDDLIVTLTKSSSISYFLITYNLYISNSKMAGAYNSYISLYSSVDGYAEPISRGDVALTRKRVTGGFRSYYDGSATYDAFNNGLL